MTRRFRSSANLLLLIGVIVLGGFPGAMPEIGRVAGIALAAPYMRSDLLGEENKTEARVRELRDSQIAQIKKALSLRNPANRRADLYLRLSELELEAYRAEFILEGRVHDKRISRAGGSGEKLQRDASRARLREAISACREILELNLRYEKMDQVLYFLGYAHTELDEGSRAEGYFRRLVQDHPRSPLAHDAWREIGESAFEDRRWRDSVAAFQSALKVDRKQPGAARVLHRLAWAHYRLRQYDIAVASMKESVALAGQHGEALLSIREEALRDMALFMTENGQVDSAISYFQSVSGDKSFYPATLEKLGRQYERNVEMAKAIQVYESLLKTNPEDEATLRVRAKLVDLDLRAGKPAAAAARIRDAKLDRDLLQGKGASSETKTALQNLRAQIRRTATEAHDRYRRKGSAQDLQTAELFYETYLEPLLASWDPRKEIPEIRMYLAEVKRESGKSREASDLYRLVVDSRDERYSKEAGALWTASLADAIRKEGAGVPGGSGKSSRDKPSASELEFVAASDAMQDSLGDTTEGREAALKAAQVLGGYTSTRKDAKKRAARLVEKQPKTPQAMTAARLWVQLVTDDLPSDIAAAADSKAGSELRDVISDLRDNKELMAQDKAAGRKLAESLTAWESRLKAGSIAERERDKDYDDAAKGYEEFARSAKDPGAAEKAWASSFDNWVKAGELEAADRVVSEWKKRFPESAKPAEAVRYLATRQLIEGDFKKAASSFGRLSALVRDSAAAAETQHAGARILDAIGDRAGALILWQKVLTAGPGAEAVLPVAALAVGDIHHREGRDADALAVYRQGAKAGNSPDAFRCRLAAADLLAASKDLPKARAEYEALASEKAAGPFKGIAELRLARLQLDSLGSAPPITGTAPLSEDGMKKGVQARLAHIEAKSKALAPVIASGGAPGIAALHLLSLEAWNAARELEALKYPDDWVEARRKALDAGVQQVLKPLKQKALEQWKTAWDRAQKDQILAFELPEISDRLVAAGVAGVSRAQGSRDRWRLAGISPGGGDEGVQTALSGVRRKLLEAPQNAGLWLDYGNLLWGDGKIGLARIAFDRALSINANSASALSNRGVLEITATAGGIEDPIAALAASEYFRKAVTAEDLHLPSRLNLASLFNVYRIFGAARPLWEQVAVKAKSPDAWDGLAIALQGSGDPAGAAAQFQKADAAGGPGDRFARRYHAAIREAECARRLEELARLDASKLQGFERDSTERVKQECAK